MARKQASATETARSTSKSNAASPKAALSPKAIALNEIRMLAVGLRTEYQRDAARYNQYRKMAFEFTDCKPDFPLYQGIQQARDNLLEITEEYRIILAPWAGKLRRLGELVKLNLPEIYCELRHVRSSPENWDTKRDREWEPLLTELGRVEAAASHAILALEKPKPINVDLQAGVVMVNGKPNPAKPETCNIVNKLLDAKGNSVPWKELSELPTLNGKNQSRTMRAVQGIVGKYLQSDRTGYRITF